MTRALWRKRIGAALISLRAGGVVRNEGALTDFKAGE